MCSYLLDILASETVHNDGACVGLSSLFFAYTRECDSLSYIDTNDLHNNSIYQQIQFLVNGNELFPWLQEAMNDLVQDTLSIIARLNIGLIVIFSFTFPILFIAFLMLKPVESRIKDENARTMKMLLMIPIEVIDAVPAIKEYLVVTSLPSLSHVPGNREARKCPKETSRIGRGEYI